jgi:quercetin dioxygenase-like cupin family protein
MKICKFEEAESFQTPEGMMTPIFANDNVAVTHLKVPAGLQVRPHSHPGDGILILTKGSVKLIGKETSDLTAGDLAYIPGGFEVGLESSLESEAIIMSVPSSYSDVEEFRERLRSIFSGKKE